MIRYALFIGGLLFVQEIAAQTTPLDTTITLPNVTVTATRSQARLVASPVRTTLLDTEAIASTGASTVADLLTARSGAFVKHYGGNGLATLSMRGTGASQTLILLNGHRIADPQLGQLDLALLPTLLLESVEVMSGTGSPLYGTDALGGVVNLTTQQAREGLSVKVKGGYGAFGERTGGFLASGGKGAFSGLVLVEGAKVQGDYLYLNTGLFPPREVAREGADRQQGGMYATLAYRTDQNKVRIAGWFNEAERGLPTIGSSQPRGERQEDTHLRFWADSEHRFTWGVLKTGGLVQQGSLRYLNPLLGLDETGHTFISSLDVEAQGIVGTRWLVAGGFAGGYGQARHPSLQSNASEVHAGVFVNGTGAYGPFLFYPAVRADVYSRRDTSVVAAVNPRIGLNVRLLPGGGLHLKANAGRAFRMPTFNDRFWQPGGKPDLFPERGWTYDAGLMLDHGIGQAEISAFLSHIHDQIVWTPTRAGYWAPDNLQDVFTRGVEASYRWRWSVVPKLRLDGSLFYTFTDARDRSDPESRTYDQPLRHVPRHQLKGHLGIHMGPIVFDVSGRYVGRRYTATDGSAYLDPYFLLDGQLRLRYQSQRLDGVLALIIENVLDHRYEVIQANPMPPRHARVQLTLTVH